MRIVCRCGHAASLDVLFKLDDPSAMIDPSPQCRRFHRIDSGGAHPARVRTPRNNPGGKIARVHWACNLISLADLAAKAQEHQTMVDRLHFLTGISTSMRTIFSAGRLKMAAQ